MASGMPSLFDHTWSAYTKHFLIIFTLALPGLVALLMPAAIGAPAYRTLGGIYLRTASIPDLTGSDYAAILAGVLISLFLMSFAMVNINLVIKSERTLTNIGKEVMRHLTTTTLSVFWVSLVGIILLFIVQLLTSEWGVQKWLSPLLSGIVGMVLFIVPTAMVMDDLRPWRAVQKSVETTLHKWPLVLLWLVMALVCVSVIDGIALMLPAPYGSYIVLVLNSTILLPYFVVMLGQIYISKYTILA